MTGLERLKVLRDWFADDNSVPPELVDMRSWMRFKPECGTTYCLAGWATQCPALANEGLWLQRAGLDMDGAVPRYGDTAPGLTSLEAFFGLTYSQAWWLFLSWGVYRRKAPILAKLDNLIAKYESIADISPPLI